MFLLNDSPVHLETHDFNDLRAASSNPCFDGLVFESMTSNGIPDAVAPMFRIRVACPACSDVCSSFETLKMHLWEGHLFLDPLHGVEHFLGWQSYLAQFKGATLLPWTNPRLLLNRGHRAQCPTCDHSITQSLLADKQVLQNAQHPDLVKPTELINLELKHVRMQILMLYPDFLSHPIFDDWA